MKRLSSLWGNGKLVWLVVVSVVQSSAQQSAEKDLAKWCVEQLAIQLLYWACMTPFWSLTFLAVNGKVCILHCMFWYWVAEVVSLFNHHVCSTQFP
mmetsp:Transcript_29812/g.53611  ORF Transcript_29812/g.53611 Transcript_29812/m.53611 type:complete len:96 (+) Transcript_29812:1942-2229(+)